MEKVVKKNKIIYTRLFTLIFGILFITSLFMCSNAFAEAKPFELKDATISDKSGTVTGDITSFNSDEIKNDITFHKLNDSVTYKLVIKSNISKNITILSITDDNNNEYISYEYDKHENKELNSQSTFDFLVTAIYKKELTDITKRNQSSSIKFTINYLDNNEEKSDTIIINPATGDHINISLIILIVSATGLAVCIVLDKKRKNKKMSKLSVFIITGILIAPIVVKAASFAYNITLETNYELNDKQIIKYVINGEEKTLINEYGTPVSGLETPIKEGYTFTKWTYENGKDFDPTKPITEDIKIIANFSINTYSITYDLDGGNTLINNPTTYTIEDELVLLEPIKEHYIFKGWEGTDLEEITKNVVIKNKTGKRNYVAKYDPKDYTITYKGLTETEVTTLNNPIKYNIESEPFNLVNPRNRVDSDGDETEKFVGWKEDTTTSMNITLPNLNLMGNKTFEAIWAPASDTTYTITYTLNGGTLEKENKTTFTKKTETFTLNNPSKVGYIFKGWSGTDLTGDENTSVKVEKGTRKNLSFEAHYTPNTYNIKFDKNASDATGTMEKQTFTYDKKSKLNQIAFERVGYTFTEWNTENDGSGTSYEDKEEILNLLTEGEQTLYAQWTPNNYEIEFISNHENVEGTMDNLEMTYDTSKTLTLNLYTLTGYTFDSWNTLSDGTGEKIENGSSVKNLTTNGTVKLYAQWKPVMICKKATTLHTDTCQRTDRKGCSANGYSQTGTKNTTTIVYGNISGSNPTSGDAFDCDVNGDGIYNSENERFYYIRNKDNKAVMVFYSNFEGENGIKTTSNYTYDVAVTKLPTVQQWPGTLNNYNGYAARLLHKDDVVTACGVNPGETTKLTTCDYLLENTSYRIDNKSIVRTGIWTEVNDNKYNRIDSSTLIFEQKTNTSNNVVRPVIEVPLESIDNSEITKHTITFDAQGGIIESNGTNSIIEVEQYEGSAIRTLPVPIKERYTFDGWYTDSTYSTKVELPIIVDDDHTYYAHWVSIYNTAEVNGVYYDTLQEAVNNVPTDGTKTTVTLLKNVTEKVSVNGNRNVVFDLKEFTISNRTGSPVIQVDKATAEITNGNITSNDSSEGMISVKTGGKLYISGGKLTATGAKQAIYNDGGSIYISGNPVITSTSTGRATVHNKPGGTITITGGTIISENLYALYNENGTLTIGEKDGVISNQPIIQGKTYGVIANPSINFYDGIIKGSKNTLGKATSGNTPTVTTDTEETIINEIENDSEKERNVETINNVEYKTLYLTSQHSEYKITFDPNGGTISPNYIVINQGDEIGELPIPTRGLYTFEGWYTDIQTGIKIDETTKPNGNITYYAKWSYTPSHKEFDMTNDAMTTYYSNISTWKNNEETFQTNMNNNFNNYNCTECNSNYQSCPATGAVMCDKPKGFSTGLTDDINVYTSNATTKQKGNLVNYVTVKNGTIYNMIPGNTYYWESKDDPSIYGTVVANGKRRIIDVPNVRNVRDLGGISVDVDGDGTKDGTLKYGKLFRGVKLSNKTSGNSDISDLAKLGITEEIDLRSASDGANDLKIDKYRNLQITNYEIDYINYPSNYKTLRNVLKETMKDIISGESIYFHCAIGTDRTGTLAYFLEGLLGVSEEDRLQDYELSYFYGLLNRHRFYNYQQGSSITHRFDYMHNLYPTNQSIYEFYMHGSDNQEEDEKLINQFRNAMINYTN